MRITLLKRRAACREGPLRRPAAPLARGSAAVQPRSAPAAPAVQLIDGHRRTRAVVGQRVVVEAPVEAEGDAPGVVPVGRDAVAHHRARGRSAPVADTRETSDGYLIQR